MSIYKVLEYLSLEISLIGRSRKFCQGGPDNIIIVINIFHRELYGPSLKTEGVHLLLEGGPHQYF